MSSSKKKDTGKPVSVVWLRRDLRLYDHRALAEAARFDDPVQPIFIFDTDILARFRQRNDRRLTFISEALCNMHARLAEEGGGILVLHGRAEALVPDICRALQSLRLCAAEDFEPATRLRDANVEQALPPGVRFNRVMDHLLMTPTEVLKADGTPYKVFTPYARAWRAAAGAKKDFAAEAHVRKMKLARYPENVQRVKEHGLGVIDPSQGPKSLLAQIDRWERSHDWPVGEAQERLQAFAHSRMSDYTVQRDFMAAQGTSRLSPYLRFGLLSVRECARLAYAEESGGNKGASTWINELIWRDFYAMILYHYPHTQTQEMQPHYRSIPWSNDTMLFTRFSEGKTGYPIIDAAMRQLLATGYMHNRARMIVASFMTKDLLLDWRLGEEHFAQHLMDYELSSNVGGWQWASSTGTDAQPYFRVFNPALQSRRFDPDGDYIRTYVKELASLEGDDIHEPWKRAKPKGYPEPIVDHASAKNKAIAVFKRGAA